MGESHCDRCIRKTFSLTHHVNQNCGHSESLQAEQVEQALGLVEARNRYGGVERTSNMQVPPSWNMSSITEDSSSFSTNPSLSTQSQHGWNQNNAARFEEGTTFYSQTRKRN